MAVVAPSSSSQGSPGSGRAEPRLQPAPDYGTLGPGSDVARAQAAGSGSTSRRGPFLAFIIGVCLAIVVVKAGHAHGTWSRFTNIFFAPHETAATAGRVPQDARQLDRLSPQKQAETLLELAVSRSDGASHEISSRVNRWQGKLEWNSQIATLTTAALSSNDSRVRESGIEVELAAYGLGKNSASLNYVLKTAESPDHARKVWALWALGLIANRGVETERVVQVLAAHLKDSDEDSRRWAVEGLALTGASEAIPALLRTMHSDSSPPVRERAACALAESGMFTQEQRLAAVPQLINYTDDPSLDAQSHAWAFQALGDITHERLPNDPATWRSWYEKQVVSGQ